MHFLQVGTRNNPNLENVLSVASCVDKGRKQFLKIGLKGPDMIYICITKRSEGSDANIICIICIFCCFVAIFILAQFMRFRAKLWMEKKPAHVNEFTFSMSAMNLQTGFSCIRNN